MIAPPNWPQHLQDVRGKIAAACKKAGRDPNEIRLLLATKTVPPEILRQVAKTGFFLFGENKVQELKQKADLLSDIKTEWHMIGHLQTNKVKEVVARCTLIHSLDSLNLAQEIDKRSAELGKISNALIEVNTSREASKYGLDPDQLLDFCRKIENLQHIQVTGLMTLAAPSPHPEEARQCFIQLRKCFEQLKEKKFKNHSLSELSMGMSNDFEIAIAEGATLLRIGSAIFGARA